jgi:hypothetical protein
LKKLKRGIIDSNSITKALKFSKRLLEKKGIVIKLDSEEGQKMIPPITENGSEDGSKEKGLKDKHGLAKSNDS